ncbi:MAG: hypothetical protein ACAI35_10805 [Candidatus Methylacidiphilales bacterium]
MMRSLNIGCGAVAACGLLLMGVLPAAAQSPAPVMPKVNPAAPPTPAVPAPAAPGTPGAAAEAEKRERVKISVTDMAVAEKGVIVFAVRIQAAGNKDLVLGTPSKTPNGNDKPFTMEPSILENVATGRKTKGMNDLPGKPYYGPMSLLAGVNHGEWIQLGVAFPKLQAPPPENAGKPIAYKLTVPVPGTDAITVNIPEEIVLISSKGQSQNK